jgi:hypothetical protein
MQALTSTQILYIISFVVSMRLCVCLWPLDAKKSDGVACVRMFVTTGRKEKWWEKDKTHDRAPVDDRRMESFRASVEVLKPKSWECVRLSRSWNPVSVYQGLETQVLKAKCSNAGLQARADCVRPSRVLTSCNSFNKKTNMSFFALQLLFLYLSNNILSPVSLICLQHPWPPIVCCQLVSHNT